LIVQLHPHGQAQTGGRSGVTQVKATAAADVRTWDAYVTQGRRSGDLQLKSSTVDPLVPGRTAERFQQRYKGVRIWGADIVRDSENGVTMSIFGALSPEDLGLDVVPTLSIDQGRAAMLATGGAGASLLSVPELVIVPLQDGTHRLAYQALEAATESLDRVFVDAQTGAELLRYSEIQRQQAVGSGTGVLGDKKKVSVLANGGAFLAYDTHRPPTIETFDLRGNLARLKLLLFTSTTASISDLASDTDNIWTDPAVVDSHVHVSWTYDYYYKRFGRSGLDGANGAINVAVNGVTQDGALSVGSSDFFTYSLNAFWCPAPCGPTKEGVMNFGSGMPAGYYYTGNGRRYTYFGGALDIAAHELTHAVTSYTSNLIYQNESGALNEAFSDMMGKSVEFFYHAAGPGVGQADYVLGKDISRAAVAGALNGDRSMANPNLYGDPDHYSQRYLGTQDNGGVHHNSGIANNAFYLAIEGGVNHTSGLSVTGVGSVNREQIEKVFFRAFTLLLPSSATFSTARAATIQAARDLYGVGSTAEKAVTQAWTAVGVF